MIVFDLVQLIIEVDGSVELYKDYAWSNLSRPPLAPLDACCKIKGYASPCHDDDQLQCSEGVAGCDADL